MDSRDAAKLIAHGVHSGERWADLGAGTGTFTIALARLTGSLGVIYAVDRDASAVRTLEALATHPEDGAAPIVVRRGDLTEPLDVPPLDGVLLANALHFVDARVQADVLRHIAVRLASAGRIVVVEYENRSPSRWVPFPISLSRLTDLAREAKLGVPEAIGWRRSTFGGSMYAARVA
ncbi:MAG TPA: class I SAM-dependent methyltransferase, partial [Gemmatimonadaceae bacterium]|nr:class I SAM-dependent methyltransferase [Gemmatimonadaceae bacterium]